MLGTSKSDELSAAGAGEPWQPLRPVKLICRARRLGSTGSSLSLAAGGGVGKAQLVS